MIFSYLLNMQSHPSWVCGLKHLECWILGRFRLSHPSWVCGLKLIGKNDKKGWVRSHPSWVCGLKHSEHQQHRCNSQVTPFVGVWIETVVNSCDFCHNFVTPFVGVWIETLKRCNDCIRRPSHPSWVCGLKPI